MEPLRITLVLSAPPLPFGNAAARWYYVLLRGLAERGHQVTALAPCIDDADRLACLTLFPAPRYDLRLFRFDTRRTLRSKWAAWKQPFSYPYSAALRAAVAATAPRRQLLHLEQLWSAWAADEAPGPRILNLHVLPSIDLEHRDASPLERLRDRVAFAAERKVLRSSPFTTAISDRLCERAQALAPGSTVARLTFGLDVDQYGPLSSTPLHERPTVGLVGSFDWTPTASAGTRLLTRLWPAIRRRVPKARLLLVGRSARRAFGNVRDPDVEIHEDVPDARPFFSEMDVLLYAPVRGSGVKVKVLEAFALGTPVVTNHEGIEGLRVDDDVHTRIREDDAGLVDAATALLERPALRERLRRAARARLESDHAPAPTLDRLEAIYRSLLSGKIASSASAPGVRT